MKSYTFFLIGILSLSGCAQVSRYLLDESQLYRQLHLDTWIAEGGDPVVINNTIERIKQLNSKTRNNVDMATKDYKPGNWQYEWDQAAQDAVIKKEYFAATSYYTIAAYPFLKDDDLSNRSYDFAMINYKAAVKGDGNYIEELQVNTPKGTAYAYLHLPEKNPATRLPVVVVSNGSDHTLTSLYSVYRDYLKPRGWAMISLDLPGIGSNIHIGITTDETNIIHQYLVKKLQQETRIDNTKIALMGSSFSGNAITKTAFTNPDDIAAVVNICGAVNAPFLKLKFALTEVPKMTGDAFLQRFDMTRDDIIKTSDKLALSTHYLGKVKTRVPILSINHDDDDISPPSDMKLVASSSINGQYIIIDKGTSEEDEGHCPSDEKALPIAMQWLESTVL